MVSGIAQNPHINPFPLRDAHTTCYPVKFGHMRLLLRLHVEEITNTYVLPKLHVEEILMCNMLY